MAVSRQRLSGPGAASTESCRAWSVEVFSIIVALDFNRGISIVEMQSGGLAAVNFDTTTLALK